MDAAWWETIAVSLPRPWPREAILQDLRVWADLERRGVVQRPGRPALAERWGVTDWAVKCALKAEDEWASPDDAVWGTP
jgi:hypothetical protein